MLPSRRTKGKLILAALGLIACLLATTAPGWAQSPAMARLITQINQNVLQPRGLSFQTLLQKSPTEAAVIIGLGLRSQLPYAAKDPGLAQEHLNLSVEAVEILGAAARQSNYLDPVSKQPIDQNGLQEIMNLSMSGQFDAYAQNQMGINPHLVLAPVLGGAAPSQPGGYGTALSRPDQYVSPGTQPIRKPPAAGSPTQPGGHRSADAIVGQWVNILGFVYQFNKGPGGYEGVVLNPPNVDDILGKRFNKYRLNFAGQRGSQIHYQGTVTNNRGTYTATAVVGPGSKTGAVEMNLNGEKLQSRGKLHREDKDNTSIILLDQRPPPFSPPKPPDYVEPSRPSPGSTTYGTRGTTTSQPPVSGGPVKGDQIHVTPWRPTRPPVPPPSRE